MYCMVYALNGQYETDFKYEMFISIIIGHTTVDIKVLLVYSING